MVDGICVRVSSLRCHSQAYTIKLNQDVPLDEIEGMISEANDWVRFVKNDKDSTLTDLTPASVSGTLQIPVGRVRKMRMGGEFLSAFSIGDQLLWGAAEPLRRMLNILEERS
jgi:aspartate-semialdehyde dehydrogenase